jgi:hypothetical protein
MLHTNIRNGEKSLYSSNIPHELFDSFFREYHDVFQAKFFDIYLIVETFLRCLIDEARPICPIDDTVATMIPVDQKCPKCKSISQKSQEVDFLRVRKYLGYFE